MQVFGLIMTIIFYIILVLIFGFFEFLVIRKKFNFANYISKFLFLASFLTLAIESWALIIINGGFNVYLELKVDFSYSSIIIIIFALIHLVSSIFVAIYARNESVAEKIAGFLLPALTIIGFGAATLLLQFNIVYFQNI